MRFRSSWRQVGFVCVGTALVALAGLALRDEARAGTLEPAPRAALVRGQHASAESSAGELRFELNAGQFQDDVRFLARGKRYGVYLTAGGATLALQPSSSSERSVLSFKVVGARAVEPSGEAQLEVRSNYFVGEPGQWRTDVPNFARVRYADVLPGVDVVYHGADGRELEYDLVLAPGVDPDLLQIDVSGQLALSLAENGDALLQLDDGHVLRKRAPIAYQLTASGARELVPARFQKLGPGRLGFVIGEHDASRTLVIDPVLSYSSYLGGSRFDEFYAVAADSSGNTYAAGYTTGTLFPTHAPAQGLFGGGSSDAVVVKLNPAGTSMVYSTYLGGNDADQARGLAVDATGNAYVTGVTYSANFPTLGALQPAHGGGQQDAFVTKFSATGALVYSTFLGGSGVDFASAIAVRAGEAYVTGNTNSLNYPAANGYQLANAGGFDAFVSHLSGSGTLLLSSSYLGGLLDEFGEGITVDATGKAFVVGSTGSSNFPTQAAFQASYGGGTDAFVSCLSSSGTALAFSTYLGGSARDEAWGVSVASQGGGPVVVGASSSANFPIAGAASSQPVKAGAQDAFVSQLNASGSSLSYSTYLGGTASDTAHGVALDNTGIAYVIGETSSANFPVASGFPGEEAYAGAGDAFLTAIDSAGTRVFSSYLGGSGKDIGMSVNIGQAGTLHLLGNTFSSDFPVVSSPPPLFGAPVGVPDAFVAKLPLLANTPAPWGSAPLMVSLALLLFGCGSLLLTRPSARRSA